MIETKRRKEEEERQADLDNEDRASSHVNNDKSENDYGEQDDEEDEIEYEVFYNDSDIRHTLRNQDQNLFKDIITV